MNQLINNIQSMEIDKKYNIYCYIILDEYNNNLLYYMSTKYIDLYTNTLEYTLKDHFIIDNYNSQIQKIIDTIVDISSGYNIRINNNIIKGLRYNFEYPFQDFNEFITNILNLLRYIN